MRESDHPFESPSACQPQDQQQAENGRHAQDEMLQLHIGGREPKPGWKILNIEAGEHVDFVGDIRDMSQFKDSSVDCIYGSHVLEHVSQRQIVPTLQGFHRILKPGGKLMISVPDLDTLAGMFIDKSGSKEMRFHVMRMMFGGQTTPNDFHLIGLNFEFLYDFMSAAGFADIRRVRSFGIFQDTSDFAPYGVPISLNVIAQKPAMPRS